MSRDGWQRLLYKWGNVLVVSPVIYSDLQFSVHRARTFPLIRVLWGSVEKVREKASANVSPISQSERRIELRVRKGRALIGQAHKIENNERKGRNWCIKTFYVTVDLVLFT